MNIVIPSYKRADSLKGKDYFITARYVVPESQAIEYQKEVGKKRVIAIPDEEDGDIIKKRNWILRNVPRPLVMIDDDVRAIKYYEGRSGRKDGEQLQKTLEIGMIEAWMEQSFSLTEQFGAKMWGLAVNYDHRIYLEQRPFSLSNIVLGPFQGHLAHDLEFDPRVGTKDDYDMALQQLRAHNMIFRWNKFHYVCDHGSATGGIVSYRSKERETQYCKNIMIKWGTNIIKYRIPGKTMSDLLNAKSVSVPIKGV